MLYQQGPDPASIERDVTHISKDDVREIEYYKANCIVFLPK